MEEFVRIGFWLVHPYGACRIQAAPWLGEYFIVRTWVEEILKDGGRVQFEILKKKTGKLSADGHFHYTMVNLKQAGRKQFRIGSWESTWI